MANRIEGVEERLLECAKAEFLEKGFEGASLRVIAAAAGTSTNSIYVRFSDKAGLFNAIIEPVTKEFVRRFEKILDDFSNFSAEEQKKNMNEYTLSQYYKLIDFIYDNFDEFKLLQDGVCKDKYQAFIDQLVKREVDFTLKYLVNVEQPVFEKSKLKKELFHSAMSFYFNGTFEIVRLNMSKKKAKEYTKVMSAYHKAGFEALIKMAAE